MHKTVNYILSTILTNSATKEYTYITDFKLLNQKLKSVLNLRKEAYKFVNQIYIREVLFTQIQSIVKTITQA